MFGKTRYNYDNDIVVWINTEHNKTVKKYVYNPTKEVLKEIDNGITGSIAVEDLFIPEIYKIDNPNFKYDKNWADKVEKTHRHERVIK